MNRPLGICFAKHVLSLLAAPLAQTCSLLYRRFLTCPLSPASNVLPITNRGYDRLKICATLNTCFANFALAGVLALIVLETPAARADLTPLIPRETLFGNPERVSPQISPDGKRLACWAGASSAAAVLFMATAAFPAARSPPLHAAAATMGARSKTRRRMDRTVA